MCKGEIEGLTRDIRQTKASMWRICRTLSRRKRKWLVVLLPTFVTFIFFLMGAILYQASQYKLYATDPEYTFVTSQTPQAGKNYFYDTSSELSSTLELRNCTLRQRFDVGLIKQIGSTGQEDEAAYALLEDIFDELNQAYVTANANYNKGYYLNKKEFNSNDDVDDYVKKINYRDKALCFALGWQEFDTVNHVYQVDLRWNYQEITPPRRPQTEYEESDANQLYLYRYGQTGFLQAMTTITNNILKKVYGATTAEIQLLYTPMESKDFDHDNFSEVIATLFAISMYAIVNIPKQFVWATSTSDEPRIQKLAHRLGYRKSAELFLEWSILLVLLPTVVPIMTAIVQARLIPTSSFGFIYVNCLLFAINQLMVSHIVDFFCDNHIVAEVVEIIIEVLNIGATLVAYAVPVIDPTIVNITSFLPLPALTWMIKLSIIASNKSIDVAIGQPNLIVNGNYLTTVMRIAFYAFLLKVLFMVYLWPIKINNDEKGSNGYFYFFTSKYWKSCFCCNKRVNIEQSDIEEQKSLLTDDSKVKDSIISDQQKSQVQMTAEEVLEKLHKDELQLREEGMYEAPGGFNSKRDTLQLDSVVVEHGGHHLVDHMSLTVFEGEVMTIVGENGSGKSSLLQTISGSEHVHHGSIKAFNVDLLKHLRFQKLNFLTFQEQEEALIDDLTPSEHIYLVNMLMGIENIDEIIKQVLVDYDLKKCSEITASKLSATQRKRLALAIALQGDTKVVLLDTPTAGMDATSKLAIWDIIKKNKKKKCFIVVTQDMREAQAIGDRIALIKHGKLQLCGSPEFIAEKFNHSVELTFSIKQYAGTSDLRTSDVEKKNVLDQLSNYVKTTIESEYQDKVKIGWNMFSQLVVKLPSEIEIQNIDYCIDMKKINQGQGKLYESLNIGMTPLAVTLEKLVKDQDDEEASRISRKSLHETAGPQILKSVFLRQTKVRDEDRDLNQRLTWGRSTYFLLKTEFGSRSHWVSVLWLALILVIILGQETVWCFIFTHLPQPILNYSNVGSLHWHHGLPVLTFFNNLLPDGLTSTQNFMDYFLTYANQEEEAVFLQANSYVPPAGESVKDTLQEFGTHVFEDAECYEDEQCVHDKFHQHHMTGYAAYYIYQLDEVNDKYSIGVLGNQIAAATCPAFGANMLQTLAKKISKQDSLVLDIRNHILPINNPLFPEADPLVGEAFGGAVLAGAIYVMIKQVEWYGQPINTGFHSSFLIKGGQKSGYFFVKYLRAVLSNVIVIGLMYTLVYAQKITLKGTFLISFLWILLNPLQPLALCGFATVTQKKNYKQAQMAIIYFTSFLGVVAVWGSGLIVFGYDYKGLAKHYLMSTILWQPVAALFGAIEFSLQFQLNEIIKTTKFNQEPYSDPTDPDQITTQIDLELSLGDTWTTWFICWLFAGSFIWLLLLLVHFRKQGRIQIWCRNVQIPHLSQEETEDTAKDVQLEVIKTAELINKESLLRKTQAIETALSVCDLQCFTQLKRSDMNSNDIQNIKTLQVEGSKRHVTGMFTVRGVSFSIDYGERFIILGANSSGATPLILSILGIQQQVKGKIELFSGLSNEFVFNQNKFQGIVGYQPQTNSICMSHTVAEHLYLFARLAGVPPSDEGRQVENMIDAIELKGLEKRKAEDLSHGQVRRLTLGMALIGSPKLIILENPLTGVDPVTKRKLINTILHYTNDRTLLMSTHDCDEASLIGTRLAIMKGGKFLAIGSVSEIIENHGKSFTVQMRVNMPRIRKQAPNIIFQFSKSSFVETEQSARQLMMRIYNTLKENKVDTSCNFAEQFKADGLLKNIYDEFMLNSPYPPQKLINMVLVQNLAMIVVEQIYCFDKDHKVAISSIKADQIILKTSLNDPEGGVQLLIQDLQQALDDLPIAFFSMQATDLIGIFTGISENQDYANESIKMSSLERFSSMGMTSRQTRMQSAIQKRIRSTMLQSLEQSQRSDSEPQSMENNLNQNIMGLKFKGKQLGGRKSMLIREDDEEDFVSDFDY